MHEDHYGLSGRPFQLTPDPRFWFDTATHRKAMAYLGYGLSQGEGFVVITGDPGVGKTTLVGHLLSEIDAERLNVIKLVSARIGPEDLLRLVCGGLDIDAEDMPKAAMLTSIELGLHAVARQGRRTLLIVDEAQALPIETLEELRMLSNFQAGGYPLLQIFLLGQPEFRMALADQRLEQLRQRVIAMHHLEPMSADEVEPYLIHRLSCVGWRGKPRFTNDAISAMYSWSHGSPRLINQLAARVMLFGAVEQIETFGRHELAHVIADLDQDITTASVSPARVQFSAAPDAWATRPSQFAAPAAPEPEPFELYEVAPMSMGTPTPPVSSVDSMPLRPRAPVQDEPVRDAPTEDAGLASRIAQLETQMHQQDEALRRVLTLLVDWVEKGEENSSRPDISPVRGAA